MHRLSRSGQKHLRLPLHPTPTPHSDDLLDEKARSDRQIGAGNERAVELHSVCASARGPSDEWLRQLVKEELDSILERERARLHRHFGNLRRGFDDDGADLTDIMRDCEHDDIVIRFRLGELNSIDTVAKEDGVVGR